MMYMNRDTGVLFTLDELRELWEQFQGEMSYESFDDFVDTMQEVEA